MKAAVYRTFGGPDVVQIEDVPPPTPGPADLLVDVHAAAVTTADRRLRAADFPSGFGLVGRLIAGWSAPRHPILGLTFAGVVREVGPNAAGFTPGDRVFGFSGHCTHAEQLVVPADGPVVRMPDHLDFPGAAAVPFAGLTALDFLTRHLAVSPGQTALITGAAGDCGGWFVQLAHHLGLRVTTLASATHHDHLRSLGADFVLDRHGDRPVGPFDLVIDTVGAMTFAEARPLLAPSGRFVPLVATTREVLQALWTRLRPGPRVIFAVSGDRKDALQTLADLLAAGAVRPVVDQVFPFEAIRAAHARVDSGKKRGSVVVRVR